jgi:hypothetical protein
MERENIEALKQRIQAKAIAMYLHHAAWWKGNLKMKKSLEARWKKPLRSRKVEVKTLLDPINFFSGLLDENAPFLRVIIE